MTMRPFIVGGRERFGVAAEPVLNPDDGSPVADVSRAGPADLEEALAAARRGFEALRRWPAFRRAEALHTVARRLEEDRERFARTIALEAGKPIVQARIEVQRATGTVRTSAEEATRIGGEVLPLDLAPGLEGRTGWTRRFPVGPVACITPFNFPLNLVAHKIAPAIAAGCSFVLKPASKTPLSALDLVGLFLEAGLPPEALTVLPLRSGEAAPLVEDPRTRAVSFTGSPPVGWEIARRAHRKKVILELGGNAGLIVDRSADLDLAATRAVTGAFSYAGQSCISVQRVYVHREVFDPFLERFLARASALVVGSPLEETTAVGPVISSEDAERIEKWVASAVAGGARVLLGGPRRGNRIPPTVLTGTRREMEVCSREVFGPIVVVEAVRSVEEAIARVDDSEYGLQAGIFTASLASALHAYEAIEVGALIVNDAPTFRIDPMPYGGVKMSGMGREGPRYAIEDYTEKRLLVVCPEGLSQV